MRPTAGGEWQKLELGIGGSEAEAEAEVEAEAEAEAMCSRQGTCVHAGPPRPRAAS